MLSARVAPYYVVVPLVVVLTVLDVWLIGLAVGVDSDTLRVSFLDVGQGDAIFIETPEGTQVLVDGGTAGKANRPLSKHLPFYDRSIDMVVGSHADGDHIGGLQAVLKEYRVNHVILPVRASESNVYSSFKKSVRKEKQFGSQTRRLSAGKVVDLGGGVYMLVLSPGAIHRPADSNDSSLVAKLMYGKTSVLLTGDISRSIEMYLASQYGKLLDTDILKVAHHGSDSSSANAFLSAASPARAVISAGKDNQYGHPHPQVLKRLDSAGAESLCTCDEGTITLESDGEKFRRMR